MKIIGNKVFFYTNEFSNFHKCEFTDPTTGIKFSTSEQAFMWFKARFFGDLNIMKKLEEFGMHPRSAKSLGRLVAGYDDKSWECVRLGYMVYANYLKFSQNEDIGLKLLETDDKILVEASPVDKIWGIGLAEDEDDYILQDERNWDGRNLLGKALMEVRTLLRK